MVMVCPHKQGHTVLACVVTVFLHCGPRRNVHEPHLQTYRICAFCQHWVINIDQNNSGTF